MSDKPTCSTCRHWGRPDSPQFTAFRPCSAICSGISAAITPNTAFAYTRDELGLDAWLCTNQDFSCILHEPKDPE